MGEKAIKRKDVREKEREDEVKVGSRMHVMCR